MGAGHISGEREGGDFCVPAVLEGRGRDGAEAAAHVLDDALQLFHDDPKLAVSHGAAAGEALSDEVTGEVDVRR